MKNYIVDFSIKNSDGKIEKKNVKAKKKKDKLIFCSDDDNFTINIKDNILFEKENSQSKIIFNFMKGKRTDTKYYIKDLDFYIDTSIITNDIIIDNNKVKIEYDLWIADEYSDKFIYEINIKEE